MRRNHKPRARRTRRRRTSNLLGRFSGRRNNLLVVVIIAIVLYVLWRYPEVYQQLMTTGPSAPSFPR